MFPEGWSILLYIWLQTEMVATFFNPIDFSLLTTVTMYLAQEKAENVGFASFRKCLVHQDIFLKLQIFLRSFKLL